MLVGLRPVIPTWVSYTVANGLTWFAVSMQVVGLRLVLRQPIPAKAMVFVVVLWLLVFEYFRLGLQNSHLRFGWALIFFAGAFAYIAYLARQIYKTYELRNAQVLAWMYTGGALVLCVRIMRIAFGYTEPDATAQGVDSFLVIFSGVLVSVMGSFAFVGVFIERSAKREMAAITERVRQEESFRLGEQVAQLERQRTLGMMSYSFAHEFSQPLTAILMDAYSAKETLAAEPHNSNALKEAIQGIETNANRTRELVDRIRNFIRPSQDAFEKINLKMLVQDVQHLLTHDIRKNHIKFEWDFEDEESVVMGDKVQLSQILLNVYRNAIQAMSHSQIRKIFVSVGKQGDRVVVRVRDTGPGLDESMRLNIGMPFVTTKSDGLGVGLSISQSIAEKHSGTLAITNAKDGGALVELNLPADNS
ncbi:MAG TPA: ATP-binding protein [Limnohabitans sp.]|nr:ATP-binding protein [Limnohabitans sp.]HQR86989.1 ATP-binding protein [Limnohabitans sp.]